MTRAKAPSSPPGERSGEAAPEADGKSQGAPEIPALFLEGLTEVESRLVRAWWGRLGGTARRRLAVLADARGESCAFSRSPRRDGSVAWYGVAVAVRGRFRREDAVSREDDAAEAFPVDLYEYLVNHEISLAEERQYHVCTAHEAARAALRAGVIPATFTCPLERAECPMRRLLALAPGRSLHLDVVVLSRSRRRAAPTAPRE